MSRNFIAEAIGKQLSLLDNRMLPPLDSDSDFVVFMETLEVRNGTLSDNGYTEEIIIQAIDYKHHSGGADSGPGSENAHRRAGVQQGAGVPESRTNIGGDDDYG